MINLFIYCVCGRLTEHAQETDLAEDEAEPQEHENAENIKTYWNIDAREDAQFIPLAQILVICHDHGLSFDTTNTDDVLKLKPTSGKLGFI